MKKIAILCLLLTTLTSQAQLNKKFYKLLHYETVKLDAEKDYDWVPKGDLKFYPSQTVKGDTTGASNDGEYLLFHDKISQKNGELFKLFRLSWVSNYEYDLFINWVKDSMILERVYANTDPTGNDAIPDELIGEMLNHPDDYYDSINEYHMEFDPSQPAINRQLFTLSWRMKCITDGQIIPLISEMYLPSYERYNRTKDWDERQFYYVKKNGDEVIFISPDRDRWAEQSQYPYDYYYNLAHYYSIEDPSEYLPVIGLHGTQIQAFLDYEERRLQNKLDENGYNYEVHLSLPTEDEIKLADTNDCDCKMEYIMEEKNMTDHWRITNGGYWEFLSWVQDSIIRENIYRNDADVKKPISDEFLGDMLSNPDVYYDEVNLSWVEFDPAQPFINRSLFTLDFDFNWKKKIAAKDYVPLIKDLFQHPEELDTIKGKVNHKDFKPELYTYRYEWQDLARRSQTGELKWNEEKQRYDLEDSWSGKDLDMDKKPSTGARSHADLSRFIIEETVSIYPGANCALCNQLCVHEHGDELTWEEQQKVCDKCPLDWDKNMKEYDFWTNPEELVTGLTYAQALAFYNWKYHRHTWWNKTNTRFHDDLVPTPVQYEKIQRGETVIVEEQKLTFPDPWFRYVIHFYEK